VVNLQQQAGRDARRAQPAIDLDHGALDDVCSRALHRRVDRLALRALSQGCVARGDVVEIEPAAEYRFDIAALARLLARLVHVATHARISLEIQLDVAFRLAALDAESRSEPECGHAVDEPEVDHLRGAPLIVADLLERQTEN